MTKKKNTGRQIRHLIQAAKKARKHSCAPWTGVKVGSALLTKNGKIYSGANIESIIPNSTICAERNAIFKAISEGERDFTHVIVLAFKNKFIYPCGTCRQILSEYSKNLEVIVATLGGKYKRVKLKKLLPHSPVIKKNT